MGRIPSDPAPSQTGGVEPLHRLQEVCHVVQGEVDLARAQPFASGLVVEPLRDQRQVVARNVGHDVVEARRGQIVLQHQAQVAGGLECAALAHDLRHGGAVGQREGLDDHLLCNGAPRAR